MDTTPAPEQPLPQDARHTDRLAHLEALAELVYQFVEQARAIDARYTPEYADLARELRALGYQVRADIPHLPPADAAL
jgi:hypothetical protein